MIDWMRRYAMTLVFFALVALGGFSEGVFAAEKNDFEKNSLKLKEQYARLEEGWQKEKSRYQRDLENFLKKVESHTAELKKTLDYGDRGRRESVNEELADFGRMRDDVRQLLHQITAATASGWSEIKGDTADVVEDVMD